MPPGVHLSGDNVEAGRRLDGHLELAGREHHEHPSVAGDALVPQDHHDGRQLFGLHKAGLGVDRVHDPGADRGGRPAVRVPGVQQVQAVEEAGAGADRHLHRLHRVRDSFRDGVLRVQRLLSGDGRGTM